MAKTQSVSARISAVLKSYKTGAANVSTIIGLAVEFAQANSHNPVHIQKIIDGVDPQDATLITTIVKACGPFNVTEGVVKVKKVKKGEERIYNADLLTTLLAGKTSFRTIAGNLSNTPKVEAEFDLAKYAATVMKRLAKEGVTLEQAEKALEQVAFDEAKAKAKV